MSNRGAHPEIGSIIRKRDEIHACLYPLKRENYQPLTAIRNMQGLLYELEDKFIEKRLVDALKKEEGIIEEIIDQSVRDKRYSEMRFKYREWFSQVNKILWEGKYLLNQKYGPVVGQDDVTLG